MKISSRFVAAAMLLVSFVYAQAGYSAGTNVANVEKPMVLFVDAERVMSEALVAKDIRAQLDRRRAEMQGTFARREEKLREGEAELARQRGVLSTEAYTAKVNEFRKKVDALNQDASAGISELETLYGGAMGQVQEKLQHIAKSIAADKVASVVLFVPKGQVLYVDGETDVTDKVLEVLNRDMSRVSLGD